jgi:hypothetical protein
VKLIETENSFQLTDFKIVSKHSYKKYSRAEDPITGQRMYAVDGTKLPSVTTILSATKDRSALDNWIKRVGQEEADRIKNEASSIGTEMHTVIENYIAGIGYLNLTDKGEKARKMAHTILKNQSKLSEVWGSEVSLAYEGKYAGATDLIGIWNDKTAILDWKQTNKPKRKEWIEDYFLQLGAYTLAHGKMYEKIETAKVCLCSRNYEYQEFFLDENELKNYQEKWWERYTKYLSTLANYSSESSSSSKSSSESESHSH